jgi:transposase InsO family protein
MGHHGSTHKNGTLRCMQGYDGTQGPSGGIHKSHRGPHGLPNSIISDRGSLFTSKFWKQVMETMGTTRNLSTAFHPETDGQTERTNATLEQYLRAYCNYQQTNWTQLLPIAEFCYKNVKSESTGVTPFYANFGYHPHFQPDLTIVTTPTPEVSQYISTLTTLQQEL